MPIKVAIADDHLLIISSIENTINAVEDMELCGKYTSGGELIKGLEQSKPDVLLLDYHLPDQNGGQLARNITYHYPEIKILALTGFDKPDLVTEMLESGCMGYLLKTTANTAILIEAINRIYDGHMYIDKSIRDKYVSSIHRNIHGNNLAEIDTKPKLTNREIEILQGIATELSSQEIADKLSISRRTVENHRNSIMIKLGAKNAVGLIKFAIELKLI
jgi:DNA-binding NarL/FixJ family response regulator